MRFAMRDVLRLVMATIVCLGAGCGERPTSLQSAPKIAVLQYGSHEVIDEVAAGIEERYRTIYGNADGLSFFNGNFDDNTLQLLATQMVSSDAEVLIAITTPASQVLMGTNRGTKPFVFTFVSNAADLGYTGPGSLRNATGLSDHVAYQKTRRLIEQVAPEAKEVGYLLTQGETNAVAVHEGYLDAFAQSPLTIRTGTVTRATDVRLAAETLAPFVDCFLFGGDNTVKSELGALFDVAGRHALPVFASDETSVADGALAGYSVDYSGMGRRTLEIAALVAGGADPNKIPLEIFTADRLILNRNVAERLGFELDRELTSDASRVIE